MTFDVIIVGAGPAGATAAKVLGDSGVSTLLLDKSAFPRDKPCGGGISARVMRRFPYLERVLTAIPTKWISKIHFEAASGAAVEYESDTPMYLTVRRCEFDALLVSLAQRQIACQLPALVRKVNFDPEAVIVTAEVEGEQRSYRSRIILGCDGVNSIVARAAGLRRGSVHNQLAIDMMEETSRQELNIVGHDRMYIRYGEQGQYGYSYIFPKAHHLNLGVGLKLDRYLSELRGKHYSHYCEFVQGLISRQLLVGGCNSANFRAFPLPISGSSATHLRPAGSA